VGKIAMLLLGAAVLGVLFVLLSPIRFDLDIGLRLNSQRHNHDGTAPDPNNTPTAPPTAVPSDLLTITITGGTPAPSGVTDVRSADH
jgi:hypothetical protein